MSPLPPAIRTQSAAELSGDQWLRVIISHLQNDAARMAQLKAAASLSLPGWCLAAGFVRNAVWDYCHGYEEPTTLTDIDLIYFDPLDISPLRDQALEQQLNLLQPAHWSVKNQARMHVRNGDAPYQSSLDAMSFWPELETAVGAYLQNGELRLASPYPLVQVLSNSVTANHRCDRELALRRLSAKRWLHKWPALVVRC